MNNGISNGLRKKIEETFKSDEKLRKGLLSLNPEAIQDVAIMGQKKIDPEDVIYAYENEGLEYLYEKAKKLMEMQKIYEELCESYFKKNLKDNSREER